MGGYKNFEGLGIKRIKKYYNDFGFGEKTQIEGFTNGGEKNGLIPDEKWKKKIFKKNWNVGNTYYTSIGQFGTLVTPMQVVTAVSAVANNGKILKPKIIYKESQKKDVKNILYYKQKNFNIIKKAMRETALSGTTKSLNLPFVKSSLKIRNSRKRTKKRTYKLMGSWIFSL